MSSLSFIRPTPSRTRQRSAPTRTEELKHPAFRLRNIAIGSALGGTALAVALALLSHSTQDPSWNTATATSGATRNWLGLLGSYGADLLLQLFGGASVLLPLILAIWGWRTIVADKPAHVGVRLTSTIASILALSVFLNGLGNGLPFSVGSLGQITQNALLSVLPAAWGRWALPPAALLITGLTFYLAAAMPLGTWRSLFGHIGKTIARTAPWTARLSARLFSLVVRKKEVVEAEDESFIADEEDTPEKPTKGKRTRKTVKALPPPEPAAHEMALPPLDLLQWPESAKNQRSTVTRDQLEKNAALLQATLTDFGVDGAIVNENPGPVVTLYELEPAPGIRATRVITLAPDIARSMSALSARVAVVPGKNVIGIELPNLKRETVYLRELLESSAYSESRVSLPLVLGKDIGGNPVIANLAKMPHLLVAGTTGSGKSVSINAMILSLLYCLPPDKCKMVMIDPKMVELNVYEDMPHLLTPVVTEPKKAVVALKWVVKKMEERNRDMSKIGAKNIDSYNQRIRDALKNTKKLTRTVQTGFDKETGHPIYAEQDIELKEWPFIVVIVDEMADLMQVAGKDIEFAIQRLAQMGRAAGIHLIAATQRPSVDVITGTIKSNFPARISFRVSSKIDSRTILNEQGAEQLLGQGDMLFANGGTVMRVHGPYVKEEEIEAVVEHLKAQGEPEYDPKVIEDNEETEGGSGGDAGGGNTSTEDSLYDQAVAVVLRDKKASVSYIQRRLGIGYNKAATLVERMQEEGVVGPDKGSGKREIFGRSDDSDAA